MSLAANGSQANHPLGRRRARRLEHANGTELRRWLGRNENQLTQAGITTDFGRAPTLSNRRGSTWISFGSARVLGRAVVSGDGDCSVTAHRIRDGAVCLDATMEAGSPVDRGAALAALVACISAGGDNG